MDSTLLHGCENSIATCRPIGELLFIAKFTSFPLDSYFLFDAVLFQTCCACQSITPAAIQPTIAPFWAGAQKIILTGAKG
jgi:hypothetical protein